MPPPSRTPTPRCTVRACGRPLGREARRWVCEAGHSFDIARSGYCNLLQPQDRRSLNAGDAKETVEARRRLADADVAAPLVDALAAALREAGLPPRATLLDVGCGEGTVTTSLAGASDAVPWGVDLSVPAIEAAAKRHPGAAWFVANADRGLPFVDGAFDAVVSITGRRHPAEFARVLAPGGLAALVVPASDDLAELRDAVLGEAVPRDRLEKVIEEFGTAGFETAGRGEARHRRALDAALLADALAMTYRGARRREQERLARVDRLEVTFAWSFALLRVRAA